MAVRKIDLSNIEVEELKNTSKIEENFEHQKSSHASANMVFNKPSYYSGKGSTHVKITANNIEKEIPLDNLEKIISENKKISKIVIEEVTANDIKRTNLIFSERKREKAKKISHEALFNLENEANRDFLQTRILSINKTIKNELQEAISLLGTSQLVKEKKAEVKYENNDNQDNQHKYIEVEPVEETPAFSNLTLDDSVSSSVDESLNLEINTESKVVKKVEINKHEFKRKKNSKILSKLYYKVTNHIELFKLGDSYLRDYNRGIKSIAFNGHNVKSEREKTILGISSFLNYNAKITVTVVINNLKSSIYAEHLKDLEKIKKKVLNEDIEYSMYVAHGVEFIEYSEMCDIMYQLENVAFEDFIENFVDDSDIVLWDLPMLSEMNNKKEVFYPIIRSIESVSLIVKSNYSKYKDVYQIKDYFEKYKIPLKGLVLAGE